MVQSGELIRVGESKARKVNVRLLSATNRNLEERVKDGLFREDLYYRLRVIEIHVPPLRERPEDILSLARNFVKRFSKKLNIPNLRLDATALDYLQYYSWPGNVRELENAIEYASVMSRDGVILPETLPSTILQKKISGTSPDSTGQSLSEVETKHILAVLQQAQGNQTKAARILGISQTTLWRKLKNISD